MKNLINCFHSEFLELMTFFLYLHHEILRKVSWFSLQNLKIIPVHRFNFCAEYLNQKGKLNQKRKHL